MNYFQQLRNDEIWLEKYDLLLKYQKLYDTVNVPIKPKSSETPEWERKLGNWVATQRAMYRKNKILDWRYQRLEEIGFDWDPLETNWEKMFQKLLEYKDIHRHTLVPYKRAGIDGLGSWVFYQRLNKKKLSYSKIKRLDDIGFEWSAQKAYFMRENIRDNAKFIKDEKGRENVLKRYKERIIKRTTTYNNKWDNECKLLLLFKKKYGHLNIPYNYIQKLKNGEIHTLGTWATTQRIAYSNGRLPEERIKKLSDIGFVFEKNFFRSFDEYLSYFVKFKKKYNSSIVPLSYCIKINEDNIVTLGWWVASKRRLNKKGMLKKEEFDKLNSVGFEWNENSKKHLKNPFFDKIFRARSTRYKTYKKRWDENLSFVKNYYEQYGDFNIPNNYNIMNKNNEKVKLRQWLIKQIYMLKIGKLSKSRINKFNKINFDWNFNEKPFEKNLRYLIEFKEKYGFTDIPSSYTIKKDKKNNFTLGSWVINLRYKYHKGELSKEIIDKLDSIGFAWETPPMKDRLKKLQMLKKEVDK